MPIYEYECQDCGKQFEVFQGISEKPLKKCQYCHGKAKRLISQSSFALKGGGWYRDGYSKKPPKAAEKADSKAPKASEEKSGGGSGTNSKPSKVSKQKTKAAS